MHMTATDLKARAVTGSRGIAVISDPVLHTVCNQPSGPIVLTAGSAGPDRLGSNQHPLSMLQKIGAKVLLMSANGAAPPAFPKAGSLKGHTIINPPEVVGHIHSQDWIYNEEAEIVDGRLITSRGPDTVMEFVLPLIKKAGGRCKRQSVAPCLVRC